MPDSNPSTTAPGDPLASGRPNTGPGRPFSAESSGAHPCLLQIAAGAACVLFLIWAPLLLFAPDSVVPGRFHDVGSYYQYGRAFLNGSDPYKVLDFRYWPLTAALSAPLALLPPALAFRLWAVCGAVAACLGFVFLMKRLQTEVAAPSSAWLVLVALGIRAFKGLDPAPRQTIETLEEDKRWLKEQVSR